MLRFVHFQQIGIGRARGPHRVHRCADLLVGFLVQVVDTDETHAQHQQADAEERRLQLLSPAAVALPGEQRATDGPRLGKTAGSVHQGAGNDVHWDAVGYLTLGGGDTRHGLDNDVVAGSVSVRAILSEG